MFYYYFYYCIVRQRAGGKHPKQTFFLRGGCNVRREPEGTPQNYTSSFWSGRGHKQVAFFSQLVDREPVSKKQCLRDYYYYCTVKVLTKSKQSFFSIFYLSFFYYDEANILYVSFFSIFVFIMRKIIFDMKSTCSLPVLNASGPGNQDNYHTRFFFSCEEVNTLQSQLVASRFSMRARAT